MFSFSFRFPLLLDGRCNLCRKAKGMKGSTIKIIIISRKFLSPRYKTISDARMGGARRRSGMELLLIALRKKQRNETGSFKTRQISKRIAKERERNCFSKRFLLPGWLVRHVSTKCWVSLNWHYVRFPTNAIPRERALKAKIIPWNFRCFISCCVSRYEV